MKKKNVLLVAIGAIAAMAATLFIIKKRSKETTKKPPKKAPQLDIENPGDQSEFISSPSDSELG